MSYHHHYQPIHVLNWIGGKEIVTLLPDNWSEMISCLNVGIPTSEHAQLELSLVLEQGPAVDA